MNGMVFLTTCPPIYHLTFPWFPTGRIELLSELALFPAQAVQIVEDNKDHFDSQGNLNPTLVSELRYCAQPAKRVIDIFKENGREYEGENRSTIDVALLKGFWTPIGLVEKARVVAHG